SICNYYTGKKNKAYELFENGYSINPKISRVRIIGYLQSKKFNFALPMLEFETQKNADAFNTKWLGQLYLMSKRYEDAVIFLNKSASINPNDPQTFFNLAGSHFYNNNKDEALTVINKCLSLSPNFPKADEWKRKIQK
ncbi:MAG: CDC27 family protein, partial [Bacteroidota bacterium]